MSYNTQEMSEIRTTFTETLSKILNEYFIFHVGFYY